MMLLLLVSSLKLECLMHQTAPGKDVVSGCLSLNVNKCQQSFLNMAGGTQKNVGP